MINIVIPTYKRAGKVQGYDYFETAKLIVSEKEKDEYSKYYDKDRIIIIPNKYEGNIAKKRNWILTNIKRPLLMIDDDVKYLINFEGKLANDKLNQNRKMNWKECMIMIVQGFNLAFDWGCKLWGINVNSDGRNYQQYKPFGLSQVILGPFQGHLEHDFKYDENMGTKEDYDLSLQILNKNRKILRINKYAYVCEHGDNKGGIVSMRSKDLEIEYCYRIMKKWGSNIIKYKIPPQKVSDLLNGRVNIPIDGV